MKTVGILAGMAVLYALALVADLTRYTTESAIATAAGSVIGAAILPWGLWMYVNKRRPEGQKPSLAAYLLIGTAACLLLIYIASFTR